LWRREQGTVVTNRESLRKKSSSGALCWFFVLPLLTGMGEDCTVSTIEKAAAFKNRGLSWAW
jgi:hypothetical protein